MKEYPGLPCHVSMLLAGPKEAPDTVKSIFPEVKVEDKQESRETAANSLILPI